MKRTALKSYTGFKRPTKPMPKFRESSDPTLWSLHEADMKFSVHIRTRDGKCLNCGSLKDLGNSHFHGRNCRGTRFDPDNCITLCNWCHAKWEYLKRPGQIYYVFMVNRLGQISFDALALKASVSIQTNDAIRECMNLLARSTAAPTTEIII